MFKRLRDEWKANGAFAFGGIGKRWGFMLTFGRAPQMEWAKSQLDPNDEWIDGDYDVPDQDDSWMSVPGAWKSQGQEWWD